MKKKVLTFILSICFIISAMFCLSACSVTSADIKFKVENGYIQYYDGETWCNLISIHALKGEDGTNADVWTIGTDGYWYKNGTKTDNKAVGQNGESGNGIKSIAPSTDPAKTTDTQTTYIITLDNSDTYEFVVKNGTNGDDGTNGDQYTIGTDGYWYKNGVKTEYKAVGEDGTNADVWTIGIDGYWYKNGTKTDNKAIGLDGKDATYKTYTVTYEYDFTGNENIFDNYKLSQEIESTEWLTEMPTPKPSFGGEFDGWYIQNTNKRIENYDFIGGNITLEAHWKSLPAGYYNNSTYLNWSEFETTYQNAINETSIIATEVSLHPSYFENLQGILVIGDSITEIKDGAFTRSGLTKIVMPDTITSVGKLAFYNCAQLTDITLSENIKDIKESCFYGCSKLKNINIPSGVETIGSVAFFGCKGLTELRIPESVNNLYNNPFRDCSSLVKIVVDNNNLTYDSRDNCNAIIEKTTNTLVVGCNSTVIPSNISGVGFYAFGGSRITSVTIPSSVKNFGEYIFEGCSFLNEVVISEGITELPKYMFKNCISLESIVIPTSLTYIPMSTFVSCSNLKSVTMENNSSWTTAYLENNFSFTYTLGKETDVANLFISIDNKTLGQSSYGVWIREVNECGFELKNIGIKTTDTSGYLSSYIDCYILIYAKNKITLNTTDFKIVSNDVTYEIEDFVISYQHDTLTTLDSSAGLWMNIKAEDGKTLLNSDSVATIYYKDQIIAKINY